MRKAIFVSLSLALLLVLVTGCNNPPVELAGIKRVAVMSMDSAWHQPMLGRAIKYELLASIPRRFAIEVIDGAALEAEFQGVNLETVLARPEAAAELGRRYGVDGFVVGTVTAYEELRDGRLGVIHEWTEEDRSHLGMRINLGVQLAFNTRLVRADDGSSLFYRQASGFASRSITLDPKRPFLSMLNLFEPHFAELRDQAVRRAVHDLIWDLVREYGR